MEYGSIIEVQQEFIFEYSQNNRHALLSEAKLSIQERRLLRWIMQNKKIADGFAEMDFLLGQEVLYMGKIWLNGQQNIANENRGYLHYFVHRPRNPSDLYLLPSWVFEPPVHEGVHRGA